MRRFRVIIFFCLVYCSCISDSATKQVGEEDPAANPASAVDFKSEVLPFLKMKCSPCHFEGGKMYGKMPFDKAATITEHKTGILKRFRTQKEAGIIWRYLFWQESHKQESVVVQ